MQQITKAGQSPRLLITHPQHRQVFVLGVASLSPPPKPQRHKHRAPRMNPLAGHHPVDLARRDSQTADVVGGVQVHHVADHHCEGRPKLVRSIRDTQLRCGFIIASS